MKRKKALSNDKCVSEHFEELIDKYAGGFVFIVDGKVVYSHKDGTPRELLKKIKREYPDKTPLFFRVPRSYELICAL